MDIVVTHTSGLPWIRISGRMDSMTAPDVERCLNELITSGHRQLILDMGAAHYMSSLALRVLLTAQKQLKKAGGEIAICQPTPAVVDILTMSGFNLLFQIYDSPEAVTAATGAAPTAVHETQMDIEGVSLRCIHRSSPPGKLSIIGSQEKLADSRYEASDVVMVRASDIQYGAGLATVGDAYDDYRHFFGEAVVLNHSLFFYPAVKRPAADFMLCSPQTAENVLYPFLHGLGFGGEFSHLISFEGQTGPVELDRLAQIIGKIIPDRILGFVLLAESSGLWGMHLRQTPLAENRPANGKPIFDTENFQRWIHFPVEPAHVHHIVAGAGLIAHHVSAASRPIQELFARGSRIHCHAGIFSREPLSKHLDQFEHELQRITTELPVSCVQHLMGQSCFHHGMIGIIELEI